MIVAVFFLAAGTYFLTLSPSISVGDSPELTASAFTLGIAHPPGYPLFSLLGKAISLAPLGVSVAYRVNLLSALLGGISICLLFLSIRLAVNLVRNDIDSHQSSKNGRRTMIDNFSALLGSLTFAFSPIFWSQAVSAEVYTLNAAFFSALILFSLKIMSVERSTGIGRLTVIHDPRVLYLTSFAWGLSLSNHHTMIAFGPVLIALICLRRFRQSDEWMAGVLRDLSVAAVFLILGISVYLYMPVRSIRNPFMDWGDTERLGCFLDVILRKQFSLGSRAYSADRALQQIDYYLGVLIRQITLPGLLLGCMGALLLAGRRLVVFSSVMFLFLIHGICTVLILNPAPADLNSMDVMIIPSFMIFSLWIGLGVLFAVSGVSVLFLRTLTERKEAWIIAVMSSLFITIPGYLAYANFGVNDQSRNRFAVDYARDVFEELEPGAVIFVEADLSLFPLWYLQYVEGERRDVAVLDVDMLMLPWFKGQLRGKYPNVEITVPDVVKHAKGGRFKPLSIEALESYKVSQTEAMLDSLMDRNPVYFAYEFGVPFKELGERRDVFLSRKGAVFKAGMEPQPDQIFRKYHALGSIEKAVESKEEEVLFIGRAYLPAMERWASKELATGHRERSMGLMESVLAIDPYSADSLNNLAFLYAEDGKRFSEAEEMVRRAIAVKQVETIRYLKTLGYVYLKKGDFSTAVNVFEDVLSKEPGSAWTRLQLNEALKGRETGGVSP